MNTLVVIPSPRRSRRGVTLLLTLFMLALITIIVVGLLGTMTWEAAASRRTFDNDKARAFATLGMNSAVAQLRSALGPWDNPFVNFTNTAPTFYWSVSPGILTRWSYTQVAPLTNYPLFSIDPNGATNLVNLNAAAGDGTYPIAGGAAPPNFSVYWVNVLRDPTKPSGSANPLIGRYAYWIDDENAKININTADGTMKYQTNSLGLGTPTEVSLQELQEGGANLTTSTATNIVAIARTNGFNSPHEILRAAGTTPDVYSDNVFNLTVTSRSPELNVFGQARMPLVPVIAPNNSFYTGAQYGLYNCATLQPPREFYPSQWQLGTITFTNSYFNVSGDAANTFVPGTLPKTLWPQAPAMQEPDSYTVKFSSGTNAPWANGQMIASYLAGTNAAGKPVTWPAFSGSSATSYLGKYTPRQIDSITMQIMDLATTAQSPDWGADPATTTRSVPHTWRGWLSGQLVTGVGRTPKVDKILMEFQTFGPIGTFSGAPAIGYTPPRVSAACYLEFWFPSHFRGTSYLHRAVPSASFAFGSSIEANTLNNLDFEATTTSGSSTVIPSPLPKIPLNGGPNPPDTTTKSLSYWGNNLLYTDQGVDWEGNNASKPDADQVLAQQYHPNMLTNGAYYGAGQNVGVVNPVFAMNALNNGSTTVTQNDWIPGEYRCVFNGTARSGYKSYMQPSAAGGTLNISGGVTIDIFAGSRTSDAEIVPLESRRGAASFNTGISYQSTEDLANEAYSNPTVFSRVLQSVIPINVSIPVPIDGTVVLTAPAMYVYATVADPLVNKFPGDWVATNSATAPTTSMQYGNAATVQTSGGTYARYYESAATLASITDPDSYWLPTIDNLATLPNSTDPPSIPRSARFPSVGYLQYVRTGVIPDDETVAYSTQHGTPFRLINFSPSTSANQAITHGAVTSGSYPDWAMLDLFYLPSSLLSYGSPYEIFAGPVYTSYTPTTSSSHNPTIVTYSNTNVVNNMLQYGTYGGATSGRINPNGAVAYTTNVNIPTPGITRNVPLQALLHGLAVNHTQSAPYTNVIGANDFYGPFQTAGTAVDEVAMTQAIVTYLNANGPLRLPAEICNVPEVAATVAPNNATRNDLVRQIVGNLTTQSNTYSVWVAGESILKSKANNIAANQGIFESGDQITGNVRYHFIVERYLEIGTDGVYGNAANPGGDNNVGTMDDPVSATLNPSSPRYLYRVDYAEEIR